MTGSGVPMGVFEFPKVPVELNTVLWSVLQSTMVGRPESLAFKVFRNITVGL